MISPKVVILCHCLGPYHMVRYQALRTILPTFQILQLFEKQSVYRWQIDASQSAIDIFSDFKEPEEAETKRNHFAICNALDNIDPDVVISVGYSERLMRAAALWAHRNHKKSIMMTDTWKGDKRRYFLKEQAKSLWCRTMYDAFFL